MKKNGIKGILLSVFAVIFAACLTVFGLNLNIRANADGKDYNKAENWFGLHSGVQCEKVGENSFDFTYGTSQNVLWFDSNAFSYLINEGYDAIRITYLEKNASSGTNMRIFRDGEAWNNTTSEWTNGVAKSRDFDIKNGNFSIQTALSEGTTQFNLTFEAIDYNVDYGKVENWFTADVDCIKVSENSFDFTTDNSLKQVLHFNEEALAYLVEQGYDAIRITYYGKNGAAMNLAIAKDNNLSGWTNENGAGSQDFDITGGGNLIIKANYAVKDGIDGFNFTFEAIDYDALENLFSVFDSDVTVVKVNENSFDFTRANNGGVLSFKTAALNRLVEKGYDLIRVSYVESNPTSGTALDITNDKKWGNWTNGKVKSRDFDITKGAFSLYCAKSASVTTFNLTFTLIDKDVSVVTYKINGVEKATEKIAWSEENLAAKMPAEEVENTETIGYEYNGGFYRDLSAVYAAVEEYYFVEVNAVTLRLETADGAAIRTVGTAGLRFSGVVGKSGYVTDYGMILTVRKNVDKNAASGAVGIENFTKEGLAAAKLKYLETNSGDSGFRSYEENGNVCFNIVLTNVQDSHLSWQYMARTYVTVTYKNGETACVYSDVDFANNARSATDVADMAIAAGKLTESQIAFAKENYYPKSNLTLTAYYGPAVGVYMEDGELISNVTDGPVYRMATVEDVKAYFDAGFTCISGDDADYLSYRASGHAVGDGYSETDDDGNYKNTDGIKLLNLVKEYCDTYGVAYENARVFVKLGYLEGAMGGNAIHSETQIKANVTKFYNHLKTFPCFGGFILRDEPRGYMAETYNKWYKWLAYDLGVYRDGYSLHNALLGMNAAEVHVAGSSDSDTNYSTTLGLTAEQYRTYLDKYIGGLTGFNNEYLSFDYYPFTETITRTGNNHTTAYGLKSQYFQNLEEFATASEKSGFKRGLCLQSTAFYNKSLYDAITGKGSDDSYTYSGKVSEEMMSYQLYTALAYGFDRISYFTYMQPFNQTTAEYFDNSPYMWSKQSDGTYKAVATDVYESVKNANAEIVDLYKRINGFSWLGTAYSAGTVATANVFSGTTSYVCGAINSLSSSYDAIVGCMKDLNGRYGFMVVNSDDPRNVRTNSVTLTFGNGYNKVYYYENGVRKSATLIDGKFTVSLGAGKGVFVVPEHAEAKRITLPAADKDGTVYPYIDEVKSYLEIEGADVADYIGTSDDAVGAVVISWENLFDGATSFRLEYSVNENYSDAIVEEFSADVTRAELYNLLKATKYYARVVAEGVNGNDYAIGGFTTSDMGPRVMKIDGIYNVRDLGGYVTESGERTLQGLFFRGGALSDDTSHAYNHNLTANGAAYMRDVLGIKTDFDLRTQEENLGLTSSPIPGATLEYYNVGGYSNAFGAYKEAYRKVFTALADKSRYPVYMHCTGGADRTGTVSFLVNALCGVDEATLIKDYEMTSFSVYGERNSQKDSPYGFPAFLNTLKAYSGNTLSEKTAAYMKEIGVSETDIYNIKAIMLGKETKTAPVTVKAFENGVTLDSTKVKATGENVIGYDGTIGEVSLKASGDNNGGTFVFVGSYGFYMRGGAFRVAQISGDGFVESNPRVIRGDITVAKLKSGATIGMSLSATSETVMTVTVYVDGAKNFSYDFTRVADEIPSSEAYMAIAINTSSVTSLVITGNANAVSAFSSDVTLNSDSPRATGENVVGYEGLIGEVNISGAVSNSSGGVYIFVGSYGFYIRGGAFRVAEIKNGSYAEKSPRIEAGSFANYRFTSACKIGIKLETGSDDGKLLASVYVDDNLSFTYEFTRVSDEISSAEAKMTIEINASEVTSLTIKGV